MNIVSTDVENEVKNKNDEVIFFFFSKQPKKMKVGHAKTNLEECDSRFLSHERYLEK